MVSIAAFQAVVPGSIPGRRIQDFSYLPNASSRDAEILPLWCESVVGELAW